MELGFMMNNVLAPYCAYYYCTYCLCTYLEHRYLEHRYLVHGALLHDVHELVRGNLPVLLEQGGG
jgi:hypothetical protein